MADGDTERILILLQAKDAEFQAALARANKTMAKFESQANRSMGMANRRITANLKSMAGAGATFGKNFVTGLAVGAITAAFALVSTGIRDTIADIADMADAADRVDIKVGDFQGLERGFSLAGVSADELTTGLEKFTQNIGEAAQGSGKLGDILKANGIALKTSDGSIRSTTDILRDFSDVLARTPDAAARMSLITDAFGRGGKSMVLAMSQGSAGIDEMIKSAKEGGFVLEDSMVNKARMLDDKFDDLTRRARVFFETLTVGVAGYVEAAAQMNLEDLVPGMDPTAVLGADAVKALEGDSAALERNKDQIAKAGAYYIELNTMAQVLTGNLRETADALLDAGHAADSTKFWELTDALAAVVAQWTHGQISGDEFRARLAEIKQEAQDDVTELGNIDGVEFGGLLIRLDTLGRFLVSVATAAHEAALAVAGIDTQSSVGGMGDEAHGGRVYAVSPLAPTASPVPQRPPVDFNVPDIPPDTGGSNGGQSAANDLQREAARLYDETRTEAEKYALELAEINDLMAGGYITDDTYARGLEQINQKYNEMGEAAAFWKDIDGDMKDAFLDMATTGVNSFDQITEAIKRAMLQAMLFGEGPLAGLFGTGGGGLLGGLTSSFGGTGIGTVQAKGGVWSNGVQMFAKGGVVSQPTAFGMSGGVGVMGEAGPEAIMPLARAPGGGLGVRAVGGGGAAGGAEIILRLEEGVVAEIARKAADVVVTKSLIQYTSKVLPGAVRQAIASPRIRTR